MILFQVYLQIYKFDKKKYSCRRNFFGIGIRQSLISHSTFFTTYLDVFSTTPTSPHPHIHMSHLLNQPKQHRLSKCRALQRAMGEVENTNKKGLIKRLHQTCQPFGAGKSFKSCLIFLIIKTPDEPIDICVGVLNLLILTVTLWRTFWSSESLNTSALTFRVHLVMLLCSRFFVEVKAYTWCNTDNIVYAGGIKDNEIHVL